MNSIVIEINERMAALLDALVITGLFGPNRDTAAQRLLEQKMWEMSMEALPKLKQP